MVRFMIFTVIALMSAGLSGCGLLDLSIKDLSSKPGESGPVVIEKKLSVDYPYYGGVYSFKISQDNRYVVYDSSNNLYSIDTVTGQTYDLSGIVVGNLGKYEVHPSNRVVFEADKYLINYQEVFSVNIDGTDLQRMHPKVDNPNSQGGQFQVVPGQSKVVSLVNVSGVIELYSANLDGSGATKISGSLVAGGAVRDFKVSPDGSRVVFGADKEIDGKHELFSVNIDGSGLVKISDPSMPNTRDVCMNGFYCKYFEITADSQRVVYQSNQFTSGVYDLFSVPLAGGSVTALTNLPSGTAVVRPTISPNSDLVAFRADRDANLVYELFMVPLTGGAVQKINDPLPSGGDVFSFEFSPDQNYIIYTSDQTTDGITELHSWNINTSGPVTKISHALPPGESVSAASVSSNSAKVVYYAGPTNDDIYVTDINAATGTQINTTDSDENLIQDDVLVYRDGHYTGDEEGFNTLWAYDLASGGSPIKLNGFKKYDGWIRSFKLASNNNDLYYIGGQINKGSSELYRIPLNDPTQWQLLSRPNGSGYKGSFYCEEAGDSVVFGVSGALKSYNFISQQVGDLADSSWTIKGRVFTNDGRWGFMIADDGSGDNELYRVDMKDRSLLKLSAPLPTGGDIGSFEVDEKNQVVIYEGDQEIDGKDELYLVNFDGTGWKKLNEPVVDVYYFYTDPSSRKIAYLARMDGDSDRSLMMTDYDKSSTTAVVSASPTLGYDIEVSYADQKAVFVGSGSPDSLWTVNLDGSNLQQIDQAYSTGGDIDAIKVFPKSGRIGVWGEMESYSTKAYVTDWAGSFRARLHDASNSTSSWVVNSSEHWHSQDEQWAFLKPNYEDHIVIANLLTGSFVELAAQFRSSSHLLLSSDAQKQELYFMASAGDAYRERSIYKVDYDGTSVQRIDRNETGTLHEEVFVDEDKKKIIYFTRAKNRLAEGFHVIDLVSGEVKDIPYTFPTGARVPKWCYLPQNEKIFLLQDLPNTSSIGVVILENLF